jgi:predicted RNA-binding protein YlqC (UPF0109 family)
MQNEETSSLHDLLQFLVRGLVDRPNEVRISEIPGDQATTYEIAVDPTDRGKVIGKHGRIANALRVVARSVANRHRQRVNVEIVT